MRYAFGRFRPNAPRGGGGQILPPVELPSMVCGLGGTEGTEGKL